MNQIVVGLEKKLLTYFVDALSFGETRLPQVDGLRRWQSRRRTLPDVALSRVCFSSHLQHSIKQREPTLNMAGRSVSEWH